MTAEQYVDEVIYEIQAIRNNATPAQINRLNFSKFNPNLSSTCIYGQMTFRCTSLAAGKLIQACKLRVVFDTFSGFGDDNIFQKVSTDIRTSLIYVTPLETFIVAYPRFNGQILAYLKGEQTQLPDLLSLIPQA